jgi:hypothetical protein
VRARPGLIRVCAHLPAGALDLTGLRVLLTTDILVRGAELRKRQAFTIWAPASEPASEPASHAAGPETAAVFNILPPAMRTDSVPSDDEADVHVFTGARHVKGADEIAVARASLPDSPADGTADMLADHDALAIRLALLSCPYQEPADLTEDMLAAARATLAEWRTQVARWAESPSRRVPEHIMTEFLAAAGRLDAAAIVTMLRALAAQEELPPGARFETFLYADRVLALDLPSDIGRSGL